MGLRRISAEGTLYLTAYQRAFVKEAFQCAIFLTGKVIFQLNKVNEAFGTDRVSLMVKILSLVRCYNVSNSSRRFRRSKSVLQDHAVQAVWFFFDRTMPKRW